MKPLCKNLLLCHSVVKDQVNIPAGTIKGWFDTPLGNPHKAELLADVPFLLPRGVQLLHEADKSSNTLCFLGNDPSPRS